MKVRLNVLLNAPHDYSCGDCSKCPIQIRAVSEWWWLRSHGCFSDLATYVNLHGAVCGIGNYVDNDDYSVRPALIIENLKSLDLELYSKIRVLNMDWIIISDSMALADKPIGYHIFDEKSNDYDKSEIKKWLEDWFKRRLEKEI